MFSLTLKKSQNRMHLKDVNRVELTFVRKACFLKSHIKVTQIDYRVSCWSRELILNNESKFRNNDLMITSFTHLKGCEIK